MYFESALREKIDKPEKRGYGKDSSLARAREKEHLCAQHISLKTKLNRN